MSRRWQTLNKMRREEGLMAVGRFLANRLSTAIHSGSVRRSNTVANNLALWSRYDWSACGEEWMRDPDCRDGIVEDLLRPYIPAGSRILEIGPGAGRWTEYLIPLASRLVLVDLTPECIRICRQRFSEHENIEFFVNNGRDLSCAASNSVDRIWSFDVFVHIQRADVAQYLAEFRRILISGGMAIIHHSAKGETETLWRSDMTAEWMIQACREVGLSVMEQFRQRGRFHVGESDIVSVISK
jgi:SAM-dependent methyltransferase